MKMQATNSSEVGNYLLPNYIVSTPEKSMKAFNLIIDVTY
jgi:hypothetical protein